MKKIGLYCFYFLSLIKYFFALVLSVFCKNNKEYKDLWIVSERGQDARGLSSISWTQKCENQPDKIKLSYSIGDKKLMAE